MVTTLSEVLTQPLTLEYVAQLAAADPEHRYELSKGALTIMPPADDDHNAIVSELSFWLISGGYGPRTVLANCGLRTSRDDGGIGRSPDLLVRTDTGTGGRTVWLDPADVLLVVEVVSVGSEDLDRVIKPKEYAEAGVDYFWRVERDGAPMVQMHRRVGNRYMLAERVGLAELVAREVPELRR
jgi:Uma2 family endonuclease